MELLVVIAIIGILAALLIFGVRTQLAKGRDAKRKSDLAKIQMALEDYLNDNLCYPEQAELVEADLHICGKPFAPYLFELPCDPTDNTWYNYFYSPVVTTGPCKGMYKIFTKLEFDKDPIIAEVGCGPNEECPDGGCGPSCNYNYWIGSPNVTEVAQLPGEYWPEIPGIPTPPPGGTPTPPPGASPTPTPTPGDCEPPNQPAIGPGGICLPFIPCIWCSGGWVCINQGNPLVSDCCRPRLPGECE